jgi:hypothetical protein
MAAQKCDCLFPAVIGESFISQIKREETFVTTAKRLPDTLHEGVERVDIARIEPQGDGLGSRLADCSGCCEKNRKSRAACPLPQLSGREGCGQPSSIGAHDYFRFRLVLKALLQIVWCGFRGFYARCHCLSVALCSEKRRNRFPDA